MLGRGVPAMLASMKLKQTAAFALVAVALVTGLTGCGGGGDSKEAQACVDQLEQTLKEAGSDRALTQAERDACNDPEQRAFILGE